MENFIPYKADIQEVEEFESFDYDGPTEEEERAQYEHDKACETRLEPSIAVEIIDRDTQARNQLETLGYAIGEKVFVRFIHPDREGAKNEDFIYPNIPWTLIDRLQDEDKGCYFVVNGQGQKNENVLNGKAVFYQYSGHF